MTEYIVSQWDSGQPNAKWDVGLQWDVNVGPSPGDVGPYVALVTSEHNQKPKFMEMLRQIFQPIADDVAAMLGLREKFDVDSAVGSQLDAVGAWVGAPRVLRAPLSGVYFALDQSGVGFDQGVWKGPFDPTTYLLTLPDDVYRKFIRAKILNNNWDGTTPGAYAIWAELFAGTDYELLIQDFGNMHVLFAVVGDAPDAVVQALFLGGYLNNRPAGVTVDGYMIPSVAGAPYFGFDVQNDSVSGFDVGAWGTLTSPT